MGLKVAASTVWEILKEHGIPPAPERTSTTWADFLRNQADALLACDLFEVRTLTGARLYVFAVIEHASRRLRVMGATAHPTAHSIGRTGAWAKPLRCDRYPNRSAPRPGFNACGSTGETDSEGPCVSIGMPADQAG